MRFRSCIGGAARSAAEKNAAEEASAARRLVAAKTAAQEGAARKAAEDMRVAKRAVEEAAAVVEAAEAAAQAGYSEESKALSETCLEPDIAPEQPAPEDSDESSEPSEWLPGEQLTQRDRSPGYDRGSEWRNRFTAYHTEASVSQELKGVQSAILKSRTPPRERPREQPQAAAAVPAPAAASQSPAQVLKAASFGLPGPKKDVKVEEGDDTSSECSELSPEGERSHPQSPVSVSCTDNGAERVHSLLLQGSC